MLKMFNNFYGDAIMLHDECTKMKQIEWINSVMHMRDGFHEELFVRGHRLFLNCQTYTLIILILCNFIFYSFSLSGNDATIGGLRPWKEDITNILKVQAKTKLVGSS